MTDRLVVVGCGTVVPEGDRACSCYFVEMAGTRALLDCGPGALRALAAARLPWYALTDLVLTHFHADHVGALPGLFFALKYGLERPRGDSPLDVWGPVGTHRLFDALVIALGDYFVDPGFPVRIHEMTPGRSARLEGGVELHCQNTRHTDESVAVRLEGTASVGYTGDTGPAPALGAFLRNTEVLVCECSLTDDLVGDNHLSPSGVAQLATAAEPGRLLLTHVYPNVRARHDMARLVAAAGYAGRVEVAHEGWSCELGRQGRQVGDSV